MEKYLEKFGSNFIVAALVPSLTFLTVSAIFFVPLISSDTLDWFKLPVLVDSVTKYGIIIGLFGIILSFTLSSLNTFMLKVLEGYVLLEHFPIFIEKEKSRERKLRKGMERAKKKVKRLHPLLFSKSKNLQKRSAYLERRYIYIQNTLATEHRYSFAFESSEILPTKFGNILKAAEYYPVDRYGIDSVSMWPRLIHVIEKNYFLLIEESNNELSFLINCCFLSLAFGLISIPSSIYIMLYKHDAPICIYIMGALSGFAASYVFYRASLFSVAQYGNMICGAYDLFKGKLMSALGYKAPDNLLEEKYRWRAISEFMNIGEFGGEINIPYANVESKP